LVCCTIEEKGNECAYNLGSNKSTIKNLNAHDGAREFSKGPQPVYN